MKISDLSLEQVKAMSQSELFVWGELFAKERQAEQIRKVLLDYLEAEIEKNEIVV